MSERHILLISALVALLLAIWGIGMGIYAESGAIMLDGGFNFLSAMLSFIGIRITGLTARGYSQRYPLGYFAYEPLLILVKGISILVLVAMALSANLQVMLEGGREPALGSMLIYVIPAVCGCLLAYVICRLGYKRHSSGILQAEQQAWLINAVISGSIGVALVIVMLIQDSPIGWIDRYIDQILVICFSLLFIRDPITLVRSGFRELLLAAPEEQHIAPVREELQKMTPSEYFTWNDLFVLKIGRRSWVSVEVKARDAQVPLEAFLDYRDRIRQGIQSIYPDSDVELFLANR